jgi:hypothetical protein
MTNTITTMVQQVPKIIRTILGARPLPLHMDLQPPLIMDPQHPLRPPQELRAPQYLIFQLENPQQTMVCPRQSLLKRIMVPLILSPFQMGMAHLKLMPHPLHPHQIIMESLKLILLVLMSLQAKVMTITVMIIIMR